MALYMLLHAFLKRYLSFFFNKYIRNTYIKYLFKNKALQKSQHIHNLKIQKANSHDF